MSQTNYSCFNCGDMVFVKKLRNKYVYQINDIFYCKFCYCHLTNSIFPNNHVFRCVLCEAEDGHKNLTCYTNDKDSVHFCHQCHCNCIKYEKNNSK